MTLLDAHKVRSAIGEDTWELFEAIEDSFGVDLGSYYELAGITIGQLAARIKDQASYSPPDRCLTSAAFHQVRRALIDVRGASRKRFRPATPLVSILPWRTRPADWQVVEKHLGLTLPKLTFPRWLALVCLLLPAASLIIAKMWSGAALSWVAVAGGSVGLIIPAFLLAVPFARSFPFACETVGGLSKSVLSRNYAAFATKFGGSGEADILPALRLLIATETGRELEEVTVQTRILTDLDID